MLNIEPIRLLSGSHEDTGQTGSGCFMNVIAYLNGEPQITDQSPCVCGTIRRPAIWINDFLDDSERHQLLPFVQRAMGTATDDDAMLLERINVLVRFIRDAAALAHSFSPGSIASKKASQSMLLTEMGAERSQTTVMAANYFGYLASEAAAEAGKAAAGNVAHRKALIERAVAFMDAVCPPADAPSRVLIERANSLIELASSAREST